MSNAISVYFIDNRNKRIEAKKFTTGLKPITENSTIISPYSYLQPMLNRTVSVEQFRFALNVIKESKDQEATTRWVCNNIIPGIDNAKVAYDIAYLSSLSENCKLLLTESIDRILTSDRITENYAKLSSRFNFDNLAKNCRTNKLTTDTISEMCTLIDTYDEVSPLAKYNIALECILYALQKNNIDVSVVTVAEQVTEYFLLRDNQIPDVIYHQYQHSLKNNPMYIGLSETTLSSDSILYQFMINEGSEFKTQLEYLSKLSSDTNIKDMLHGINSISSEEDAASYIWNIKEYMDSEIAMEPLDKGILYKSVDYIPKITNVSPAFVNLQKDKVFDKKDYDYSVSAVDGLVSHDPSKDYTVHKKIIDEKDIDLFNAFKEETFARSEDVKDLLAKFKAEQDKSPNKFRLLITKFYAKKPEAIIDDLPSIFKCIRVVFLFGAAAATPIGPVFAAVTGLVGWFISRHINYKQAKALIDKFNAEIKKVEDKMDTVESAKKKEELKQYLNSLKACKEKIDSYRQSLISEEDPEYYYGDNNNDDLDDINFDDFNFDESTEATSYINTIILAESLKAVEYLQSSTEQLSKINLVEFVGQLADNHLLVEANDIIKNSSISNVDYTDALFTIRENAMLKNKSSVVTESAWAVNSDSHYLDKTNPFTRLIMECECNKVILQVVNEKLDIKGAKLAFQGIRSKLKDVNTKIKSFWQMVDANGSATLNSVEKAMTSDRREAIIKGNVIPSFSKMTKSVLALAAAGGVSFLMGHGFVIGSVIAAIGALGVNASLNAREKKLLIDEIDTELRVVEKQINIAENDQDMNQYRFLLNYQKKLAREQQRIKYGLKVKGRDIPASAPLLKNR